MNTKKILPGIIFVLSGLFYSFSLSNHCGLKSLTICIDRYWLDHWLVNYSQDFTRRGLLGELIRKLLGSELNIVFINLLCFVAVMIVFLLIFSNLYRRISLGHDQICIFSVLAFLAATPLTSVFFETLGDPLHIIFLSYLIIIPVITSIESRLWRIVLVSIAVLISLLIHEASLFLFVPAYVLAIPKGSHSLLYKKSLGIFLLVSVPLLAILLSSSSSVMSNTEFELLRQSMRAVNPITGQIHQLGGVLQQSFLGWLEFERQLYFSSYKSTFLFLIKPIRTLWIPLCSFFVISRATGDRIFNTCFLRTWLFLMLCSFPLYIIAHDWGRFAVYSFWIAFYSSSILTYTSGNQKRCESAPRQTIEMNRAPDPWIIVLIILIFLPHPVSTIYRVQGILIVPRHSLIACLPAFLTAMTLLIMNWKKVLFFVQEEFHLSLPFSSKKKQ